MVEISPTLIMDGMQRSALAVTRSLGQKRLPLVVADRTANSLAASSKYCASAESYPDPTVDSGAAILGVIDIIERHSVGTVMPMTDVSTHLLLSNLDKLPDVRLPCPAIEDYNSASNKAVVTEMAGGLGIPVPDGEYYAPGDGDASFESAIPFPRVLKPRRSRVPFECGYLSTSVRVVNSHAEQAALLTSELSPAADGFLLQEFIPGHGAGVFALFDKGREIAVFAHRRLREKPPAGGVSVLSESIAVNEELGRLSRDLLAALKWNGPAMIEFRIAEDGTPYFMEINARFWGSLQLPISSGVDFPYLAWQAANEKAPGPVESYAIGVRNRWLLGDLDSLYLTLRNPSNSFRSKLSNIASFLNFFDRHCSLEVCRLKDFAPFRFEIADYVRNLTK